MKKVFKDYIDIFVKYPNNKILSKKERREKHSLIKKWSETDYREEVSLDEIVDFVEKNKNKYQIIPQTMIKFSKVLKKDIEESGTKALKLLIGNGEEEDYYFINSRLMYKEFGEINICSKILKIEPNYIPALKIRYTQLRNWIDYSIHEIPWGILDGNSVAEKEAIPEMLKYLDIFLEISKKLNKDDFEFVENCKIYYKAWEDFLNKRNIYDSYEEYLIKNKILNYTKIN